MGDVADLRCTLSEITPLMRGSVAEAISGGTIGTVDDSCAAWMLDSWHSLFILIVPILSDGD
jgi:hypothetical protein